MLRTMVEGARSSYEKLLGFVCAALLACALGVGVSVLTADEAYAEGYDYTVTLYAGNGTIDGKDSVVVGTYGYGKQAIIDWTKYNITPPDDRYYVKGVRLAGHDDSSVSTPSFVVKENAQYVVEYGLKKDLTDYTVKYVDEEGNQLLDTQTFQGNVGDKPVVAYQYIEGYQPKNALNMTGTLSKNEAANVFTFVYESVAAGDGVAGEEGGVAGTDAADGDGTAEGDEAAAGQDAEGADVEEVAGPVELIDIDDEANPLAGVSKENAAGFSIADVLPWVLGVLVAAAVVAVIVLIVVRNRAARQDA